MCSRVYGWARRVWESAAGYDRVWQGGAMCMAGCVAGYDGVWVWQGLTGCMAGYDRVWVWQGTTECLAGYGYGRV